MEQIKRFQKIYKSVSIIALTLAILLLMCFRFEFEADNGYLGGGLLTVLFYVLYALGAIVCFSSILLPSEFEIITTPDEISGKSTRRSSTIISIATILFGFLGFFLSDSPIKIGSVALSGLGVALFGAYFALLLSRKGRSFGLSKVIFLFASIIFPISITLGNNQNYFYYINSVENKLTALFGCSFLFYILQEAIRVCRAKHTAWHFTSMLLTCMSGFCLTVSYILAFAFELVKGGDRLYQMLLILAVSLLVGIELRSFVYTAESRPSQDQPT